MAITTTSVLPPAVQTAYDLKLLTVKQPNLIHNLPAVMRKMPRKSGDTLRMRRFNKLDTATVPLGNTGVNPPGQVLTAVNIDAKMEFYGTYVIINEQVELTNECAVLNQAAKMLGISLRESEDELTRKMLESTASVQYCTNGVNGDNPTEITQADVGKIERTLLGADAHTLLRMIGGENKFGTAPVRASYFALAHTDIVNDLTNAVGFVNKNQYSNQKVLESEYGNIGALRFLVSSMGSKTLKASNNGEDVYNIFCVGMEAYSTIEQDGYSARFQYIPSHIAGGPLSLNSFANFKMSHAARILNDEWIINLQTTLST